MKLTRLVCPFLCLLFMYGCGSNPFKVQNNPKQEIGENTQMLNYKEESIESIQYPKTEIEQIDKRIHKLLQYHRRNFHKQVKNYKEERKAELNVNYESFLKDQRYISIVLHIYENIYQVHESIETIVFDTKHEKFITLLDIYDKNQLAQLSAIAVDYFKDRFPQECDNDEFRSHSSAVEENYRHFALKKNRIIFYFPNKTLFDNRATLEIGYEDIAEATSLRNEAVPTFVPYEDILNEPIKHIDGKQPMVALTFDDGPTRRYTSAILDALKENNASATFFILGSRASNAPDLLQRMVLEGSEIGNHSYSHKQLTTLSLENIEEEITATQESIYHITHRYPNVIRAPYGSKNEMVLKCAQGKRLVSWSLDTRDWSSKNSKKIVDSVMKNVKDGDVILMHDLYATSAQAAIILIPKLKEAGYQLVTVSELYEYHPNAK